jgi:hypothetical protein
MGNFKNLKMLKVISKPTICDRTGVEPQAPTDTSTLGIALSTLDKEPINGLRHPPENGTNGWYIWCGEEFSEEPDFFSSLCVEHFDKFLPQIKEYLELPPGYRFLIDSNGYEDVWFDPELLNI